MKVKMHQWQSAEKKKTITEEHAQLEQYNLIW